MRHQALFQQTILFRALQTIELSRLRRQPNHSWPFATLVKWVNPDVFVTIALQPKPEGATDTFNFRADQEQMDSIAHRIGWHTADVCHAMLEAWLAVAKSSNEFVTLDAHKIRSLLSGSSKTHTDIASVIEGQVEAISYMHIHKISSGTREITRFFDFERIYADGVQQWRVRPGDAVRESVFVLAHGASGLTRGDDSRNSKVRSLIGRLS